MKPLRNRKPLTADRLKELLTYEPVTGIFTRRKRTCSRVWVGMVAGNITNKGYVKICVDSFPYLAHRLAWLYITGAWPLTIDHINGVRTDNRFINLRSVSNAINAQNVFSARPHNKVGVLGVTRAGKRFSAALNLNRRRIYLGVFDTAEEAHTAYLSAKRVMHPGCTI